jgi:copper(I)-binding protein
MSASLLPATLADAFVAAAAPALAEGGAPPDVDAGALVLSHGFSRATLPGAPVACGFPTITNTSDADDRLVGAASDVAGHMEA